MSRMTEDDRKFWMFFTAGVITLAVFILLAWIVDLPFLALAWGLISLTVATVRLFRHIYPPGVKFLAGILIGTAIASVIYALFALPYFLLGLLFLPQFLLVITGIMVAVIAGNYGEKKEYGFVLGVGWAFLGIYIATAIVDPLT